MSFVERGPEERLVQVPDDAQSLGEPSNASAATALRNASRILVKVGSAAITSNADIWSDLATDIVTNFTPQQSVCFVVSGAVALGLCEAATLKPRDRLRRAVASYGQLALSSEIRAEFAEEGVQVASILVRAQDEHCMDRSNRIADLIEDLHAYNVVPIFNEDEAHRYEPDCFHENDDVARWLASVWCAEVVVYLTDQTGIFSTNPSSNPNAQLLRVFRAGVDKVAFEGSGSPAGSGGMASKIRSIASVTQNGVPAIVSSGLVRKPLLHVLSGQHCTWCPASEMADSNP